MEKVLCLLCLLLSTSMFAREPFSPDKGQWGKKDGRSISILPTIDLEGNILRIHIDIPLEIMEIQIYDEIGTIVYEDVVSCCSPGDYYIVLDRLDEGLLYTVWINHIQIGEALKAFLLV